MVRWISVFGKRQSGKTSRVKSRLDGWGIPPDEVYWMTFSPIHSNEYQVHAENKCRIKNVFQVSLALFRHMTKKRVLVIDEWPLDDKHSSACERLLLDPEFHFDTVIIVAQHESIIPKQIRLLCSDFLLCSPVNI